MIAVPIGIGIHVIRRDKGTCAGNVETRGARLIYGRRRRRHNDGLLRDDGLRGDHRFLRDDGLWYDDGLDDGRGRRRGCATRNGNHCNHRENEYHERKLLRLHYLLLNELVALERQSSFFRNLTLLT